MDYCRIYDAFIVDRLAKFSGKAKQFAMERHHIVPKCIGGGDEPGNLVNLTYSDHIFAHLLLAKIHGGKLAIAFQKMTTVERYRGRHTRLENAHLMQVARDAKGASMRGQQHRPTQAAALKRYNVSRRGKGLCPKLKEARKLAGDRRRGQPAHPKSLEAVSRTGAARSPAQKERDRIAVAKAQAATRGKPWCQKRRAAQDEKRFASLMQFAFAIA